MSKRPRRCRLPVALLRLYRLPIRPPPEVRRAVLTMSLTALRSQVQRLRRLQTATPPPVAPQTHRRSVTLAFRTPMQAVPQRRALSLLRQNLLALTARPWCRRQPAYTSRLRILVMLAQPLLQPRACMSAQPALTILKRHSQRLIQASLVQAASFRSQPAVRSWTIVFRSMHLHSPAMLLQSSQPALAILKRHSQRLIQASLVQAPSLRSQSAVRSWTIMLRPMYRHSPAILVQLL